jgi:hypothetical protein
LARFGSPIAWPLARAMIVLPRWVRPDPASRRRARRRPMAPRNQIRRLPHACAPRPRRGEAADAHPARLNPQISGDRQGCGRLEGIESRAQKTALRGGSDTAEQEFEPLVSLLGRAQLSRVARRGPLPSADSLRIQLSSSIRSAATPPCVDPRVVGYHPSSASGVPPRG